MWSSWIEVLVGRQRETEREKIHFQLRGISRYRDARRRLSSVIKLARPKSSSSQSTRR
jgi:hypothetical protein